MVRCIGLITQLSGKRPTGYVAPWWEFSHVTNELLQKHGIKYDHSLMQRTKTASSCSGVMAIGFSWEYPWRPIS